MSTPPHLNGNAALAPASGISNGDSVNGVGTMPEMAPLNVLRETYSTDLAEVDRLIAEALASDSERLSEVGRFVAESRGKKLRPLMAVAVGKAYGAPRAAMQAVAASLELVHNATLLHDDVIDKSSLRRGRPTINARFGDDVAILSADFLYANAFELALEALKPRVLQMICKVTSRMCEGEIFQIEKGSALLETDDYYHIIEAKTANLFGACTALGAVVGGARRSQIEALGRFGREFGLAFQITDDILDYAGDSKKSGKSIGTDIEAGKQTLPLIYALQAADEAGRQALVDAYQAADVTRVIALVGELGGLDAAKDKARQHVKNALAELDSLPRRKEWDLLRDVTELLVSRAV